jgi:hypothetical protein|tara:strand:- start:9107 stop:9616 length:510 start_codon:yes stop_codon:yes gene_type:complete
MVSFIIYIALLSVCVAFILSTNSLTSKPVKVIVVIMLIHGYTTSWATYRQVSGYPTTQQVPNKFEIIWARVVESQSGDFIELWISYENTIVDKLVSRFSLAHGWDNVSRVYRLPHSDENHEMVMKIQEKIELGEKVGIINENGDPNSDLDLRSGTESFSIEFESNKISK